MDTWNPEPGRKVNSTDVILKILEILEIAREVRSPVLTNLEAIFRKMMGTFDKEAWMMVMDDIKSEYSEAM